MISPNSPTNFVQFPAVFHIIRKIVLSVFNLLQLGQFLMNVAYLLAWQHMGTCQNVVAMAILRTTCLLEGSMLQDLACVAK